MELGGLGGGLRRLLSGSVVIVIIAVIALFSSAGTIGTGNVGVRTTLGLISVGEVSPGIYVKWPFISTVQEFSAKEINIDLSDLTPKAKDNLSLRDMDLTIYYRAQDSRIAALQAKYAGQSVRSEQGYWLPAYELVMRVARNIAYEEVARVDSLVMHTKRDELASAIKRNMQTELDKSDPGTFHVTRVVVRSVITDPSIERSIQEAVANQKKLEAMAVQTEIAKKEAEVKITEAHGIAEANRIINQSLTREYLQHEANQALVEFARKGNSNTVILPAGSNIAPLINVPANASPARNQP
ncbi:SPFH domain-containing protein [Niveibacterium sp. 24ML]|uniref:SPFH domain-containing protein n=1 Tax=Niveibacterium sp. 24ML TaxID=2985512 RepID=UPI00226DCDA1|nr:SPFH domain-containing protein [Niveibacterium sp. 24ML]MCX9156714.1 SPFH domain-containing protein [Niveibacterium sp. 24ML]